MKLKKILSLAIISLFVMSGLVFADSSWTYENVSILGPRMGPIGQTPPVEIIKVTIGSEDTAVTTGMVMSWRIEPEITDGNALGFAVEICRRGMSEDVSTSAAGKGPYAGVMVTSATSNDQGGGSGWTNANPLSPASSIGYMAIRGFVDAYVDVSEAGIGGPLVIHGNADWAHGGATGYFATHDALKGNNAQTASAILSQDIGVLMEKASADGLMKVWLR